MKCIRTAQIHEYNSNKIYTHFKQHQGSTHAYINTSTDKYDLTDDVNEAV